MKTILCYGDSNTWGFVPGSLDMKTLYVERYPRDTRWTGILQKKLGPNYYVVEEGLNGRTTNVDSLDPPDRNGKTFLPVCLYTHSPLDLVVLMLGTNDLKVEFNKTSSDITQGISELLEIIKTSTFGSDMKSSPQILLVSPLQITSEKSFDGVFNGAIARAKGLSEELKTVAAKFNCSFFDVAPHLKATEIDGIHLDEDGHRLFAELVYDEIKKII